jgi:RimJ/RimL family protein N-acetyltransferase
LIINSILTNRLVLKPLEKSDDEDLFGLHSDPEVMKFLREPDSDIFQTKRRINEILDYSSQNDGLGLWSVFEKESKNFIGWGVLVHIDHNLLNPIEVGFRLHQKSWRKGYAHEIGSALLDHAKNIDLESVCGITSDDNIASQKTLEKCGMQFIENRNYYNQQVLYYEKKL